MNKAKIGALDFEQNKSSGPLMKNKSFLSSLDGSEKESDDQGWMNLIVC